MNISRGEAEEALEIIQQMTQKTRRSVASSGVYIYLILTGVVWLVGFVSTQFLSGPVVAYIWVGISILCTALSIPMGRRVGQRVRGPSTSVYWKRIAVFWLLLIFFGAAIIAVARPAPGMQLTTIIILLIMAGQMAMGLLFSFSASWWTVPVALLAVAGYYLLPGFYYLWMGVLGGGGMILLGLYIRSRW